MICPAFCCFIYGSAAAMPYSTPLTFTSIIRSHSSTFRRSSGACGISPALFDHDVDTPVCLHGRIDQALHLVAPGDVHRYGECLAAAAGQLLGQGLDAIDAPCTQHDARALRRKKPGGRLAEPAARARDDDDLSFDVIAHDLDSCLP